MDRLNTAVIGCGVIFQAHADALAQIPEVRFAAVCDSDGRRAAAAGKKYGASYCTNYLELLEDERIDVIHICTPHYLHAPMAVAAMRHGKHVLVEKPMAITTEDAEEMIRASAWTGRKLGVCFQNRYNVTSAAIKQALASGRTGRILGARAFVTWHRDENYYTGSGWRGTWKEEGGGVLINQAIHTLDLLQWFIGDVAQIKGYADTRLLKECIEVEDTAEALIRFQNGAAAVFFATNCHCTNSPVEIEIVCEKAVIKLSGDLTISYHDGSVEHYCDIDTRTGEKSYWGCGHFALIRDFYACLREGRDFPIHGEEGSKALKMVLALYRSSETDRYVRL